MRTTLEILEKIGRSEIGLAHVSPRKGPIEIGKSAPCIRTTEDVEGLLRCGFLDPTVPSEFNLYNSVPIRKKLTKYSRLIAVNTNFLDPLHLIANRPAIGFTPPECLTDPIDDCCKAIGKTGDTGQTISSLRAKNPDGRFWEELTKHKLYPKWIRELLSHLEYMKGDLLAPPVPVITKEMKSSVDIQIEANQALAMGWEKLCGRKFREIGLLYSLHITPKALDSPEMIRQAILGMDESLSKGDLNYWGIHVNMLNVRTVSNKASRIETAKDFVGSIASTAERYNLFTFVSDVGAIGPAFLDLGAAFTSYFPGMTPRKVYDRFSIKDENLKFGKVLGLWKYNLYGRDDVRRRNDTMDDTGLFIYTVPKQAQGDRTYKQYRVEFGKPYNISVMERLNLERGKELKQRKNAKPGLSHIGRSNDPLIAPWA